MKYRGVEEKMALKTVKFVLLERKEKKKRFLMNLRNTSTTNCFCQIIDEDVEDVGK